MKLKIISSLCIALLLTGCGPAASEVPYVNKANLSLPGETVGNLPDGREVKRWRVWDPEGDRRHYVYVVESATTVSTNRPEQQGKVTVNRVDVVIVNGKEYVPVK